LWFSPRGISSNHEHLVDVAAEFLIRLDVLPRSRPLSAPSSSTTPTQISTKSLFLPITLQRAASRTPGAASRNSSNVGSRKLDAAAIEQSSRAARDA
jgi:hypothetical protein